MQAPDEAAARPHPAKLWNSPAQSHGPYADEQVQASLQYSQDYLQSVASTGNWRTERQSGYPMARHVQPSIPIITLTQPTPPYQEPDTSPESMEHPPSSQSPQEETAHPPLPQHPQAQHQAHHPPPTQHSYHALSPCPIIHFVRRPLPQIQDILQAMTTGTFSFPVFGAAGTTFQDRLTARYAPKTPRNVRVNAYSERSERKSSVTARDAPEIPLTPTPKPKPGKRKRESAQTLVMKDERGVEGGLGETTGKRKKVVQEERSCVEDDSS